MRTSARMTSSLSRATISPPEAYKCPRHVVFTELPKTSTGKIQKFKLREVAESM